MKLVKGDESGTFYINMDVIDSIEITWDGKYKVYTSGIVEPYYVSKEAYEIILKYGKAL